LLLRIEHKWIDPHFLSFWLWQNDDNTIYDIDTLFRELVVKEAWQSGKKFGELLIFPCKVIINTIENDPELLLPDKEILNKMTMKAANNAGVLFWQLFQNQKFENATIILRNLIEQLENKDAGFDFLRALESLCYFNDGKYEKAISTFMNLARDFDSKSLPMHCNLCLFFAIEAGKRINSPTQSIDAMERIAREIPKLTDYNREEISGILKSYSVSVYIGAVVLCRRIIEMAIKDTLSKISGETISSLVAQCKQAGVLEGRQGNGLYQILQVARWKNVISSSDFDIAIAIKNYGDRIHIKDGVKEELHAKYAIQACIRILRQLEIGYVSSSPKLLNSKGEFNKLDQTI
jgi:tetratricopeptide (TPR) repeat protein